MKKEPTNLQKALAVLLYDQFDCPDVEAGFDDDIMVDYIISALIEKNENICPFKNYMAEPYCKRSIEKCETGLMIDCGEEPEFAWKEFIRINDDTM